MLVLLMDEISTCIWVPCYEQEESTNDVDVIYHINLNQNFTVELWYCGHIPNLNYRLWRNIDRYIFLSFFGKEEKKD